MKPPDKIYLQINPEDPDASFENVDFTSMHSEVSWCWERIGKSDIEYVIAPKEKRKKRWKESQHKAKK